MSFSESSHDSVVILAVNRPRVDAATAHELRDALAAVVARGVPRLVVDSSAVTFIDSTGLGALVSSIKLLGRTGRVAVCGARDSVAMLFRITRMDKVFPMFPTVAQASAALAA